MSPKSYWIRITLDTISIRRSSKFYTCLEKSQCVSISRANRELSRFATEFTTFLFILSWFALSCATFLFLRLEFAPFHPFSSWFSLDCAAFHFFRRDLPWPVPRFILCFVNYPRMCAISYIFVVIFPFTCHVSFSTSWFPRRIATFHVFSSLFSCHVRYFIFSVVIWSGKCDISSPSSWFTLGSTTFHFRRPVLLCRVRHFIFFPVVRYFKFSFVYFPVFHDIPSSSSWYDLGSMILHFFHRGLPCHVRHFTFLLLVYPIMYGSAAFYFRRPCLSVEVRHFILLVVICLSKLEISRSSPGFPSRGATFHFRLEMDLKNGKLHFFSPWFTLGSAPCHFLSSFCLEQCEI